ncbi:hypothetical protein SPRG_06830 [Saprolegnia parasitica CBS 223.65]|uniref:Uncharacterized protein n=1 Tax=Saprolegnia parasitica (strain CBS 223.65) TaxID=695850 RepID=A0A067CAN5_SAPPC|nr:hypothetical protein SPRG_06830 [Saprolegnia parasitica CBS 223.65]KDO27563.1 hypothetical protein SPRG_06830 [Saprolegnia parasitica CBS 223.65]|eukprot:XP_012201688.1 hypothetical protein SPRG_06830 [Saprolegnia parasitica CBS 223.65]
MESESSNQTPSMDKPPAAAGRRSSERKASAIAEARQLFEARHRAVQAQTVYLFGRDPYAGDPAQTKQGDVAAITDDFPSEHSILELSAGYEWSAALMQDNSVYTWGCNTGGQLGHGDTASMAKPTLVQSFVGIRVVRISCGGTHGGFLSDIGALYMVGDGRYGRLGNGSFEMALTPVQITCTYDALKERGQALGAWPTFLDERGVKRDEPTTFADVSCGDRHTLALVRSVSIVKQAVVAFGDGSNGRLGVGTDKDHTLPCLIAAYKTQQGIVFPPIQKIHAGPSHSLAITHTGELYTWGNGGHGRLGHGCEESDWSPKRVEYFTLTGRLDAHVVLPNEATPDVVGRAIAAGRLHSAVVDTRDQVYMWGDNALGQLGLAPTSVPFQPTPLALPPSDIGGASGTSTVALGDHYSLFVVRRDETYHFHKLRMLDDDADENGPCPNNPAGQPRSSRKAAFWSRRPWRRQANDTATPAPGPTTKWSFAIHDPTESLELPSSMDRFLHLMATTKIAKRLPQMNHQASMEAVHHAKLATFHLTEAAHEPEARRIAEPTKPVVVKGMASWRARRAVATRNKTAAFGSAARFHYRKPSVVSPTTIVVTTPETQSKRPTSNYFGLAKRLDAPVLPTPGPGTYDIPGISVPEPVGTPFGSTAPKMLCLTKPPYAHEVLGSVELHPESAAPLVYPTSPSVKIDDGHDFSRVVGRQLAKGKGCTPGPGAYHLPT